MIRRNNSLKRPFMPCLDEEETAFLYQYLVTKIFQKGEIILKQGCLGSDLYFILSGSVLVSVSLPGDQIQHAAILKPGQFFGEVAFLSRAPITATIIAKTVCKCLILSRRTIEMLRVAFPFTAYKIEKNIAFQTGEKILAHLQYIKNLIHNLPLVYQSQAAYAHYLINTDADSKPIAIADLDIHHIARLSFCRELSKEQLNDLLPYIEPKEYDKGYRFQTGGVGKKISIVYSGAVMLFLKENNHLLKSIAVYGLGELFLQNFYINKFQSIADYVTCEKSLILEIKFHHYEQLQHQHPAIFYLISQYIHSGIARSVYVVNRQFIRIASEFHDLLK